MQENFVKNKSFEFALKAIEIGKILQDVKNEYIISRQFIRSGTSIGANIREAEHGESRADFVHKMNISLKEANETEYWVELLYKSDYIDLETYTEIKSLLTEIIKLLISIVKTTKSR